MKKIGILIVAAGEGKRLGSNQPKALIKIADREMFLYSLATFQCLGENPKITLVVPAGYEKKTLKAILKSGLNKPHAIVEGGMKRQDSVLSGLNSLPSDTDFVLIHDAARPYIFPAEITTLLRDLEIHQAVTMACRVRDTLRKGSEDKGCVYLKQRVDRENLWALGTPQGFHYKDIMKGHLKAFKSGIEVSDDTALISSKTRIKIQESTLLNFKITYPFDIQLAESLFDLWEKKYIQQTGRRPF